MPRVSTGGWRRRHLDGLNAARHYRDVRAFIYTWAVWKLACFDKNEGENTMERETILYISDQETNSDSALTALTGTGYEVVSTDSSTQAVALLFIMRSAIAVVLNHQAGDRTTLDLARSLRGVRPDVPIILLCGEQVNHLPSYLDACVDTGQSIEKLTAALRRRLTIKGFQEFSPQF